MPPRNIAFAVNRLGAVEIHAVPTVAALARERGHRAILVEYGRNPGKALRTLEAFGPDVIAYSLCSNEAGRYIEINRALKRGLRFFSVFGGPHTTFTPAFIEEDGVDAICRGEGDLAFPLFLERFGTDALYETPNFSFKMPDGARRENPLMDLTPDLDSLPFPARDLIYEHSYFMANNPIKGFLSARGCPHKCSYCFNRNYNRMYRGKGRVVRTKGVSYLHAEIQDVAAKYPLTFVRFCNDVFGVDRAWLAEFAERYPKEIGLPFACFVRPNMVDAEYVRLVKRAGCHSVYMGIECGNERLRRDVLCRDISNAQIVEAGTRFKDAGIRIFSFNMIGCPHETEEDILDTVRLNRRAHVDFADVSVFQPFPGTEAAAYCKEHGLLAKDAAFSENMYTESVLNADPAFIQRIFILHKFFGLLVDHPKAEALLRWVPNTTRLNGLLNLLYRLYYGHSLHSRIYASSIPFHVRVRGAYEVLFSKDRI